MDNKRLIKLVRNYPELYNPKHEKFSDLESRDATWKKIASKFGLSEDECSNTWIDLKYDYQNFVRKLNVWMKNKKRKRPKMKYEKEMFFLWRFIEKKGRAPDVDAKDKDKPPAMHFEFIELEEYQGQPLDLNKIQQEDINKRKKEEEEKEKNFNKNLLELISYYPELYDAKSPNYNQPNRRGIIWAAISNEIKVDVFECIHNWYEMKTRYEFHVASLHWWERQNVKPIKPVYEHAELLEFYKPFIDIDEVRSSKSYYMWLNRTTKYQNTKFDVFELVKFTKEYPQLYESDEKCENLTVRAYLALWQAISIKLNSLASVCARVWLVLRRTYQEICLINSGEHKLKDVWFLEGHINFINTSGQKRYNSLKSTGKEDLDNDIRHEIVEIKVDGNVKRYVLSDSVRLALIAAVEKYPELCDEDENDSTNHHLWNKVECEISLPGSVCRSYWLRLRKYFEDYEKRTKLGIKYPIFRYYEQMSFLKLPEDQNKQKQKENIPLDNRSTAITSGTVLKTGTSSSVVPALAIQETSLKISKVSSLNKNANTQQQIPEYVNVPPLSTAQGTIPKISSVTSLNAGATIQQNHNNPPTAGGMQEKIPKIASVTSLANIPIIQSNLRPSIRVRSIQDMSEGESNRIVLPNLPNVTLTKKMLQTSNNSTLVTTVPVTVATSQISSVQSQPTSSLSVPKLIPLQKTVPLISDTPSLTKPVNIQEMRTLQMPTALKSLVAVPQDNGTNLIANTIDGNVELSIIYKIPATLSIKPVNSYNSSSIQLNPSNVSITNTTEIDLFTEFCDMDGLAFDQILKLITAVKHFPALYDPTAVSLSHKKFIQIAWTAIRDMTKLPETKCRSMWKKLCLKYIEFLSLDNARKTMISKQFRQIFDEMKFLLTSNTPNQLNFNPDSISTQQNGDNGQNINLRNIRIIQTISANETENSNKVTQKKSQPSTSKPLVLNKKAKEREVFNDIFYNTLLFNETVHIRDNFRLMDKVKFMKCIKVYKELYCIKNPDYKKDMKRYKAWKEISFYMENSIFNCLLMWEYLLKKFKQFKEDQKKGNDSQKDIQKWSLMLEMEPCFSDLTHSCRSVNNKLIIKRRIFGYYRRKVIKLPEAYQTTALDKIKTLLRKYQQDLQVD